MSMPDVVTVAKHLISQPSVSPQDAGCQQFLAEQLAQLGFSITHWPYKEASNLWAQHGQARPLVVFAGHTDVVPAGPLTYWRTSPFEPTVHDGYLYGRGAADMKGSLAAMLVACQRFLMAYPTYSGSIGWLITSAEEGPSHLGTPKLLEYLHQQGITLDYCLVGEPTCSHRLGDTLKIGRRGSLTGHLTVYGKQGHVAYPHLAVNPIHQALAILQRMVTHSWDQGTDHFDPTTFQIFQLHAGTGASNVIPGELSVGFNLRYSPSISAEQIQMKIAEWLDQHNLHYQLTWEHSAQPFITPDNQWSALCQAAIKQVTGIEAQLSTSGGTSDGRYIAASGCSIVEFGPINSTIHQANECIKVADLEQLVTIYYEILHRVFVS